MTAKPVPEHIDMRVATDEQLRTFVDAIAAAFPGELTEPRKVLAEVSRRLTELQHRREAEAGISEALRNEIVGIIVTNSIGGTDDFPAISLAGVIGDLSELAASPPSPASGVRVKAGTE